MQRIAKNEIPSNIKPLYGNRTMQSHVEESNKMIFADILMHHRSPEVFDLIDRAYNNTKRLYEILTLNHNNSGPNY